MGIGTAIGGAFGTYQKAMNAINTVQTTKQVLDTTSQLNRKTNKYDTKLGNPGIMPKKRTWEMPKYAEQMVQDVNEKISVSQLNSAEKKKKKRQRIWRFFGE